MAANKTTRRNNTYVKVGDGKSEDHSGREDSEIFEPAGWTLGISRNYIELKSMSVQYNEPNKKTMKQNLGRERLSNNIIWLSFRNRISCGGHTFTYSSFHPQFKCLTV